MNITINEELKIASYTFRKICMSTTVLLFQLLQSRAKCKGTELVCALAVMFAGSDHLITSHRMDRQLSLH